MPTFPLEPGIVTDFSDRLRASCIDRDRTLQHERSAQVTAVLRRVYEDRKRHPEANEMAKRLLDDDKASAPGDPVA